MSRVSYRPTYVTDRNDSTLITPLVFQVYHRLTKQPFDCTVCLLPTARNTLSPPTVPRQHQSGWLIGNLDSIRPLTNFRRQYLHFPFRSSQLWKFCTLSLKSQIWSPFLFDTVPILWVTISLLVSVFFFFFFFFYCLGLPLGIYLFFFLLQASGVGGVPCLPFFFSHSVWLRKSLFAYTSFSYSTFVVSTFTIFTSIFMFHR